MSRSAVVQFCQHVMGSSELQRRLESGVKAGAGWELIVSVAHEHGFEFTAHEAADCFEHERQRRAARESAGHAETHILKQRPSLSEELAETFILGQGGDGSQSNTGGLSLNALRRVALSNDWHMELSESAQAEDESIFS